MVTGKANHQENEHENSFAMDLWRWDFLLLVVVCLFLFWCFIINKYILFYRTSLSTFHRLRKFSAWGNFRGLSLNSLLPEGLIPKLDQFSQDLVQLNSDHFEGWRFPSFSEQLCHSWLTLKGDFFPEVNLPYVTLFIACAVASCPFTMLGKTMKICLDRIEQFIWKGPIKLSSTAWIVSELTKI